MNCLFIREQRYLNINCVKEHIESFKKSKIINPKYIELNELQILIAKYTFDEACKANGLEIFNYILTNYDNYMKYFHILIEDNIHDLDLEEMYFRILSLPRPSLDGTRTGTGKFHFIGKIKINTSITICNYKDNVFQCGTTKAEKNMKKCNTVYFFKNYKPHDIKSVYKFNIRRIIDGKIYLDLKTVNDNKKLELFKLELLKNENEFYNTILVKDKNNLKKFSQIESWDINNFKTLIFHYSINWFLLNDFKKYEINFIENFFRKRIIFFQDEYLYQDLKGCILKKFKFDLCFVNVSEKDAPIIFDNNDITFKNVLTGYIPNISYEINKIKDRETDIFYRATPLPYICGDLGQEKTNIGKIIKKNALQKELKVDIEWTHAKKVYGEEWYIKLFNSKCTLATECGSKVFNWEPRNTEIQKILQENPNYTYEQAKKDFKIESMFDSCTISPKMFEAIKLGTVLIMYEGEYKGIFKPNVHYIELKKDHSNMDEVISKIKDDEYLQQMADVAYTDIIENGNYTYKDFIEYFDSVVKENITNM